MYRQYLAVASTALPAKPWYTACEQDNCGTDREKLSLRALCTLSTYAPSPHSSFVYIT
jgi:hypothetical protein